jgi:hypothetical protein
MSQPRSLLARPIAGFGALCLVAVMTLGVACGGDDKKADSDPISESEAAAASNQFLKTTLGLFTGTSKAQEFIDLFAEECREDADVATLELVLSFIQGFAPDLQGIEIEEVDLGPLDLEQTSEGTLVTAQDPSSFRVKVDGEFKPASEFFAEAGFEGADEDTLSSSVLLVRRDGQILLGDCSDLEDVTGGL